MGGYGRSSKFRKFPCTMPPSPAVKLLTSPGRGNSSLCSPSGSTVSCSISCILFARFSVRSRSTFSAIARSASACLLPLVIFCSSSLLTFPLRCAILSIGSASALNDSGNWSPLLGSCCRFLFVSRYKTFPFSFCCPINF